MTSKPFGQGITFVTGSDMDTRTEFYRDTLARPLVWERPGARIFEICSNGYLGVIVAPTRAPLRHN